MTPWRFGKKKNPHKYGAKSGDGFGSKLESAVHGILQLRERNGEISNIQRQQTVVLQDGARDVRITWRVDFSFTDTATGTTIYCEAKGFETSDYKLKLKMWRKLKPHTLEIYKGSYTRPVLVEKILKDDTQTQGAS